MIKLNFLPFCLSILIFVTGCSSPAAFTIGGPEETMVWLAPDEPQFVRLAVEDLLGDIEKITRRKLNLVEDLAGCNGNCIAVGTISNADIAALLSREKLAGMEGQWEKYILQTGPDPTGANRMLIIAGSNPRGTMFGVYHFLEHQLGVDPLYFWTGYEPQPVGTITLDDLNYTSSVPDFKFRGWFINDEDLLTEWKTGGGVRKIDYPYYGQVVAPEVIARVAEAAVRMRYNLMIPASFVDIRNPAEERLVAEASRRGLFLSMHHIEPVGVSAFGYQNYWAEQNAKPLFSFYSEPEKLKQTWREYARRWSKYPDVIWQIGLRGIADRPMWLADPGVPQSDAERARLISEAMEVQREIIMEVTGDSSPLMSTTLWAEGADFNQKGLLKIPEGVMIIFADNSPGWVWQQDFYNTVREEQRAYGVYFHHQLWGAGPHLVQGVPPDRVYKMFGDARDSDANHYAIMNVSNIREFPLGLAASASMLWDMDFDPDAFWQEWCAARFGDKADAAAAAYRQFFASYQLVGERRIPGFLDGQQRRRGLAVLRELREQLQDPVAYRTKEEEQAKKQATSQDAFRRSLSDTDPAGPLSLNEILPMVQKQREELGRAEEMAQAVLPDLEGEAKTFFTSNLLAQIKLLSSLGAWLENCILAKQAANIDDKQAVWAHLEKAQQACENMLMAQEMAAYGKWEEWYRGDKKMNLRDLGQKTRDVLELANQ